MTFVFVSDAVAVDDVEDLAKAARVKVIGYEFRLRIHLLLLHLPFESVVKNAGVEGVDFGG